VNDRVNTTHLDYVEPDDTEDRGLIEPAVAYEEQGAIAYAAISGWLDREAAVRAIETLTDLVQVADEAAEGTAAYRPFRRGDVVAMVVHPLSRYTVVSDESPTGGVDLVRVVPPRPHWPAGRLLRNEPVRNYALVEAAK
jgi:hypothetical protein